MVLANKGQFYVDSYYTVDIYYGDETHMFSPLEFVLTQKLSRATLFLTHVYLPKYFLPNIYKSTSLQKVSNIVGLTTLRLAFFIGYE